jgi:negative regulator of sigma E activity
MIRKNINRKLFTFALNINFNIMGLPLAAAAASLGIGAGLNIYNAYNANSRAEQAQAEANKLAQIPVSKYTPNSRLLGYYGQAVNDVANPQGYTSSERGRFGSRLSQILATQRANAEQLGGGGVSRAIGAIGNANSINALNDFSANDANLARNFRSQGLSRMGSSINQLQNIDNMNTQVELQRRLMKEQALGNAIQSNRDVVSNGINNLGNDLMGFGLTKMLPTGASGEEGKVAANNSMYGGSRLNPNLLENMPPNYSFADIGEQAAVPSDIRNPRIFGNSRMFRGNRFSK